MVSRGNEAYYNIHRKSMHSFTVNIVLSFVSLRNHYYTQHVSNNVAKNRFFPLGNFAA